MKKALGGDKHCALAVCKAKPKISPAADPLDGGGRGENFTYRIFLKQILVWSDTVKQAQRRRRELLIPRIFSRTLRTLVRSRL